MILYHWATGYFAPEYWATGYWQYSLPVTTVTGLTDADWWVQTWPEPWRVWVTEDDDELVVLMAAAKVIKDRRRL